MIILIDSREQQAPYISKRFSEAGIDSEIICFSTDTGTDYQIVGNKGSCAIQRKVAIPELVSELDQILYEIVPALKNFSENPVLLVEENLAITPDGYLEDRNSGRGTQMLATSYFSYLETIKKSGVDVVCTRDLNSSIWYMISLHGYLNKEHYPKHTKYFSTKECAVGMLTAVPGIGEVRAGKALEHTSIRGMTGRKEIKGLTKKQAEKLSSVLRYRS